MENSSTTKAIKSSFGYKKASFIKRAAAFYLAAALILFISYLLCDLISKIEFLNIVSYSKKYWTIFVAFVFLGFLSEQFFKSLLTFNLAKLFLGLRLVDEREFRSIGFFRAILRTIFSFLSFIFAGLGFLAILFNREKLSMHDMLVRSTVVDLNTNFVTKIISSVAAFFIAIPGLLLNLAFVLIVLGSPLFVWTSVKDYQNQTSIEISQWLEKADAKYTVPLKAEAEKYYITFLITDTGEYYETFSVEPNLKRSTMDYHKLNVLKNPLKSIALLKFDIKYFLDTRDFLNSFYVKFEKLILKSSTNRDISIRNPRFYLAKTDVLADDLLSTFNYNLIEQENNLSLGISKNLQTILLDKEFSYAVKTNYMQAVYNIEAQWQNFLYELNIKEKSELMNSKKALANNVKIFVDKANGYIQEYKIIHPGKNLLFNRVTNRFLNQIQFKIYDPLELTNEDLKMNSFDMTLNFRSRI